MKNFHKIIFTFTFIMGILAWTRLIFPMDAEEITKNVKKAYKNMKNFSADFEQTTIVVGKKRVAVGVITFQKPNLLRQEYYESENSKKISQLIVSDGKAIMSYTPMIKQMTKQEFSSKNEEIFPGFGQSLENVEKNYDIKLIKDEVSEKKGVHCVELTPKKQDEDQMFETIQVWVRDEDSIPVQVMYKDTKNGATFFFSFKNIKINSKIDESIFKFTPPSGTQIVTVPNK
ncbi:MAG: LolA family protein [Candidatus Poribacteria bacterium]